MLFLLACQPGFGYTTPLRTRVEAIRNANYFFSGFAKISEN
jgi:hypothetical protein